MHRHPTAAVERLIGDGNNPVVGQLVREGCWLVGGLKERPASKHGVFRVVAARCANFYAVAQDFFEAGSWFGKVAGERVNFPVTPVANQQPAIGVEHRQSARHVIEGDFEPVVQPLQFFFMIEQGDGVAFEDLDSAGNIADFIE